MALPTAPTVSTILTEAYTRSGIPTPTPAQLTRAEDEWLEEIKRDIAERKAWQALQETVVMIPLLNVSVYPVPSPLIRVMEIWWYDGAEKGTAQAGGANTITLTSPTLTGTNLPVSVPLRTAIVPTACWGCQVRNSTACSADSDCKADARCWL